MRFRWAMVLCAAVAVATIAGAGSASAGLKGFEKCGKVPDLGGPSPVEAANVRCERALKVAGAFVASDVLKPGWKAYNPAGCEFFLHKKGDRRELVDWFGSNRPPDFKVIYTIKTRGCES